METVLFAGLSFHAWIVIATIILVFGLMLFTKLAPEFVFLGGMTILMVTGALPVDKVLSGFSSSSVVLVGALFVVIAGLVHTGVMQWIVRYCLGTPKSYNMAIFRLMTPVAALSSFLNNTTVVALFINVVKIWAKKLNVAPSKLLIPLSYASGMGGICTLIGTPPNLLISGFYMDQTHEQLSIFTPTLAGLFCLTVGILATIAMKKLIPERTSPEEALENSQNYTVELLVPSDAKFIGETLKDAGLFQVEGGHIIEIIRFDKEIISPVSEDEFIFGGDRLVFSGQVDEILKLRNSHQLVNAAHHVFSVNEVDSNRKLRMANVRFSSSLVGTRMVDTDFEERNNMVLIAIAREGERINQSPREIVIEKGDTLLLECPPRSKRESALTPDLQFFESSLIPQEGKKTLTSSLILLAMIICSSLNIIPLLQASFLAAFAMIILRCCSINQARESIDWGLLMVFAGSISLGSAIEYTGIATKIAEGILSVCGSNPMFALAGICFAATFLTEFTSNTATAAIFFPITYQIAVTLGVNPLTFCVALMIAVSSSFATPIGSPTHMMVYGPGGYRFVDFMRHELHHPGGRPVYRTVTLPALIRRETVNQ